MRVESCGPLFAEPAERNLGDLFFSNHNRLSEPITIINPKNNTNLLVGENEDDFLKLDNNTRAVTTGSEPGVVLAGRDRRVGNTLSSHPPPVGFFLSEEEWSLINRQPDFESGGVPDKMSDLPKSYSPLASLSVTCADFLNRPQRCCGSAAPHSSCVNPVACITNEDESNNNVIVRKISSSSFPGVIEMEGGGMLQNYSTPQVQDESGQKWEENPGIVQPLPPSDYEDISNTISINLPEDTSYIQHPGSPFPSFSTLSDDEQYNPNLALSWNLGSSVSIGELYVIGSHYRPISSVSAGHTHNTHGHSPRVLTHHQSNDIDGQQLLCDNSLVNEYGEEEEEYSQDYFEDWQSQSIFLSSEVDKAKLKWNQNLGVGGNSGREFKPAENNSGGQYMLQSYSSSSKPTLGGGGMRNDEMSSFLSKFDDKVAAIWGSGGDIGIGIRQNNVEWGEGGAAGGFHYSGGESYLSASTTTSSSTPVSGAMYPWGSPPPELQLGIPPPLPHPHYDMRTIVQHQIEQQEQQILMTNPPIQQHGTAVANDDDSWYGYYGQQNINMYSYTHRDPNIKKPSPSYHHDHHFSVQLDCLVDPAVIRPPNRRRSSIISRNQESPDSGLSSKENSLQQINHIDEFSCFTRYIPELCSNNTSKPRRQKVVLHSEVGHNKDPAQLEINAMEEFFSIMDLDADQEEDEDSVDGFNAEVAEVFKLKPKTFYEQHFPLPELLHSWGTHFTPIDIYERTSSFQYSPPGILPYGHERDPRFPSYNTYFGGGAEYNIFHRAVKTLFPIRFKLCPQQGKHVQTKPTNDFPPLERLPCEESEHVLSEETEHHQQHDPFRHLTVFDWGSYGYGNEDLLSVSSGSRTPLEFKGSRTAIMDSENNNNEIQTTDWFLDGSGGGGAMADYSSSYNAMGYQHTFVPPQSDYCCDSGIGIEGSSRAGFYDDIYPEYEGGDYDFSGVGGGSGLEEGMVLQPYTTTEGDVDYGQFQTFPYNTWSTSSASGKNGKNKSRRTKGKPCKYFLQDGVCKRGINCKFSHDLTTCRYWAEGSCLKGDACPFMHCFLESAGFEDPQRQERERKRVEKRYHLQSDNDFPALGAFGSTNSTMSSREQASVDIPHQQPISQDGESSFAENQSLLILADPAGSMYEYDSFGFGLNPDPNLTEAGYFMPPIQEQQLYPFQHPYHPPKATSSSLLKNELKRNGKPTGKPNHHNQKEGGSSGSSWPRQGNKGNGSSSGTNNNWISSMISVKEKRKKKKHQQQQKQDASSIV